MKELSKIRLKEFVEMTDSEMKYLVGGASGASGGSGSSECPSGTYPCTCNGVAKGCKSISDCWNAC